MTAGEMNAPITKIAALLVAAAGISGLGGCANAFNPRTDTTSPVAPRVQALVDANREYPRWEDFPRASSPIPAQQFAVQVNTLKVSGAALAGEVARDASQMYSANLFNLVEDNWCKDKHLFVVDFNDDILPGCIITHGGEVTNTSIKKILEGGQ